MNRLQAVPFTNGPSMRAPRVDKPHIAMRAGYWRVSHWVKNSRGSFYHAHSYINMKNYKISARKEAGVANGETPTPRASKTATQQLTVNYLLPRKRIKL